MVQVTAFNVLVNWIIAVSKLVADWYFPDGTRLNFSSGIYESRGTHGVDLRRRNMDNSTTGIYCCRVPFSVSNPSARNMLCVGVYTDQGGKDITTRIHLCNCDFITSQSP